MPAKSHGLTKTSEHRTWCEMLRRIRQPNCPAYHNYGGRGLDVDPRWLSFGTFLADMGKRPLGLTLERVDNDRGYWPDNCRWDTRKQQAHNNRRNVMISYRGQMMILKEAMKAAGCPSGSASAVWRRVKLGMTTQEAFDSWLRDMDDPDYRAKTARKNHHYVPIVYQGRTMMQSEALKLVGVSDSMVINRRIKLGMTRQEAFDDFLRWRASGKRNHPKIVHNHSKGVVDMARKESPDQSYGTGSSIWATTDSRDLLFELAKAEERSVKVVLRRALLAYAEASEDYAAFLKHPKTHRAKSVAA